MKKMRKPYNLQKPLFSQWANHRVSKELQSIDRTLEDLSECILWVANDLKGNKKMDVGARGMTSEQVLRAAIVKQQNQWTYEELELQCIDSGMTKAFVRLDIDESYSKSCLQANISQIRGETWQKINDLIVQYAADCGHEKGRTIRIDATVIETNIHHPTDSSLLYDCMRVTDHSLKKLRRKWHRKWYSPVSTKDAKRSVLKIINAKDAQHRKPHYRSLLRSANTLNRKLPGLVKAIESHPGSCDEQLLIGRIKKVTDLLPHIIWQTKERIIRGNTVASEDKVVSIFEDHTDIIVKGRRKTEFGHKVFLTAGKSGLVTDCQLVQGNPSDAPFFVDMLKRQVELYGRPPR